MTVQPEQKSPLCATPHANIEGRCGHRDVWHANTTGACIMRGCGCQQYTVPQAEVSAPLRATPLQEEARPLFEAFASKWMGKNFAWTEVLGKAWCNELGTLIEAVRRDAAGEPPQDDAHDAMIVALEAHYPLMPKVRISSWSRMRAAFCAGWRARTAPLTRPDDQGGM